VAGADRVNFCEARMREEPFIVDGLPACRRSHTMERQKSKCSTGTLCLLEDLDRL